MSAKKKAKKRAQEIREIKARRQAKKSQNWTRRGVPVSPGGGKKRDKVKDKAKKSELKKNRRGRRHRCK